MKRVSGLLAGLAFASCAPLWLIGLHNANDRFGTQIAVTPRLSPGDYKKNPWTQQQIVTSNGQYRFRYRFRDAQDNSWTWEWGYQKDATDREIREFGVPDWIFEPYRVTPQELQRRRTTLSRGMFRQVGNTVVMDFAVMIDRYMHYMDPLYELAGRSLENPTKFEKVEFLLKFAQDVPYGIPPERVGHKVISGIIPPPEVFTEGWGDCDTKAVMLAAILAHDPDYHIAFFTVPGHLFMGVEGIPRPYQAFVVYQQRKFILAEPAGPGRLPFGKAGFVYTSLQVEVLEFDPSRRRSGDGIVSRNIRSLRGDSEMEAVADRRGAEQPTHTETSFHPREEDKPGDELTADTQAADEKPAETGAADGRPSGDEASVSGSAASGFWGAIAYNPDDGSYGTAWNFRNKEDALARVAGGCPTCAKQLAFPSPLCGSLAKSDTRWAIASGHGTEESKRSSLESCSAGNSGSGCRIITSICAKQ